MPLFDDIVRTDRRPRGQNEGGFDYVNVSARPGIAAIREVLERWFVHLPDNAKADIRGRFRKRDETPHQSALYELFWHELLCASGYTIEVHPTLSDVPTTPDFLLKEAEIPRFYLEATLAMPPRDASTDPRLAELEDTLNRMDSPDYFVKVEFRGSPTGNIRGRLIRDRLARWLRQLDFAEVSRLYKNRDSEALPEFMWEEQGVLLSFKPVPKGPELRGTPGARPIGTVAPMDMEFRQLQTHEDIRAALEGKAVKYGYLDLPFVVAVNVMDDFCDDDDICNALFGDLQVVATRLADGGWQHRSRRARNGLWYGGKGPRNIPVSAVVVTHQLKPTTLRRRTVEVIHNPWAARPLPSACFSLAQVHISVPDARIQRIEGRSAADILELPDRWPIPD